MSRIEKKETSFFIYSIIFAVLFNALIYGHRLGINYFLTTLVVVIFACLALKNDSRFNAKVFYVGMIFVLLLASVYFRLFNPVYRTLNYMLVPVIFVLTTTISLMKKEESMAIQFFSYMFNPIGFMGKIFSKFARLISKKNKGEGRGNWVYIFAGACIAIGILVVVMPLLLSADSVFEHSIKEAVKIFEDWDLIEIFLRSLLFLFIASYSFGYILNALKKRVKKVLLEGQEQEEASIEVIKSAPSDKVTIICKTVLAIILFVYIIFAFIQTRYLFFNNGQALPNGISYASYAREGFFQIFAISIINVAIVLSIVASIKKLEKKTKGLNIMMYVVTVLNFVFISSAFYRMYLYESAFGYTRLRLFVYIILVVEAIIMGLLAYKVHDRKFKFIRYSFVFSLTIYTALTFVNIDRIIAKNNIDRYFETGVIDMEYLEWYLSPDVISEMQRLDEIKEVDYHYYRYNIVERQNWSEYILKLDEYKDILHISEE